MNVFGVVVLGLILFYFNDTAANLSIDLLDTHNLDNIFQNYIPTLLSSNQVCKNQSVFYAENLKTYQTWAVEMFDSTTKFPSGMLEGSNYDFGNFDECIRIEVPFEKYAFTGKYCLAKFTIIPSENLYDAGMTNNSIWTKIINSIEDPSKNPRNVLRFAFCIPSNCTHVDLQESLLKVIENFNKQVRFRLSVEVDQFSCQVGAQNSRLDYGDLIFIVVIMFLLCLVLIGSSYYYALTRRQGEKKSKGKLHDIVLCFSAQKNLKALTTVGNNSDGLNCTAGMKVYSMIAIITIHRNMFDFGSAITNSTYVEQMYSNFGITFILNGPILVDTFFTISGFLATYLALYYYQKAQKDYSIIKLYIHRYLRMVSVYAVILAFYCTLFVKMGKGPLWRKIIEIEQEKCKKVWWANLLFINNYVDTSNYCMFQSWYMACDMQAFLVIPFLSLLYYRKPITGVILTISFILGIVIFTFVTIYTYKEMPILILYMNMLLHPSENSTFLRVYIPGHLRASSYYVGAAAGYFKYRINIRNSKIPTVWVRIGWILCGPIMFVSLHAAFAFYIYKVPIWFSALYGALYHIGWSLGVAWIVIAVSTGYGYWVNRVLSFPLLVILSRLTYTVYLCHGIIQMYSAGSIRQPVYTSNFSSIHAAAGDLILAYLLALILSILFEAPMIGIEKLLWKGKEVTSIKKDESNQSDQGLEISRE